jgi:hypothetical protein
MVADECSQDIQLASLKARPDGDDAVQDAVQAVRGKLLSKVRPPHTGCKNLVPRAYMLVSCR